MRTIVFRKTVDGEEDRFLGSVSDRLINTIGGVEMKRERVEVRDCPECNVKLDRIDIGCEDYREKCPTCHGVFAQFRDGAREA